MSLTYRSLIDPFLFDHIERFAALVDKDGLDIVVEGVRIMDENAEFAREQLADAEIALYIHYRQNGDARTEGAMARLCRLLEWIRPIHCYTWGKIALLRGIGRLQKAGYFDDFPKEYMDLVREKTDYDDFFDKKTMTLRGKATNYLQVAMTCAGYREKFGWDEVGTCDAIRETLFGIMKQGSSTGYMDEEPPFGRFDRYSVVVGSEISDNLMALEKEFPEFAARNLKKAADYMLFSANEKGDGFAYGRTLCTHGDHTVNEVLSSALVRGLIADADRDVALTYILRATQKIIDFWYDDRRQLFNIWLDGRATNGYRGIHRLLEVQADMAIHLLCTLENLEAAGLADTESKASLPSPAVWCVRKEEFLQDAERSYSAVQLRRGDLSLMLPLVGTGGWYKRSAYNPFPALCMQLEAAPEATYPYLVPEYTDENGKHYRPVQFFRSCEISQSGDRVEITAKGQLCDMDQNRPVASDAAFEIRYIFDGESVGVRFSCGLAKASARLVSGLLPGTEAMSVFGFDTTEELDVSDPAFDTPSGKFARAFEHRAHRVGICGYTVRLHA